MTDYELVVELAARRSARSVVARAGGLLAASAGVAMFGEPEALALLAAGAGAGTVAFRLDRVVAAIGVLRRPRPRRA